MKKKAFIKELKNLLDEADVFNETAWQETHYRKGKRDAYKSMLKLLEKKKNKKRFWHSSNEPIPETKKYFVYWRGSHVAVVAFLQEGKYASTLSWWAHIPEVEE